MTLFSLDKYNKMVVLILQGLFMVLKDMYYAEVLYGYHISYWFTLSPEQCLDVKTDIQ